jgi:1-acyl-sn-glycerol-3-phosphate acyltransferase
MKRGSILLSPGKVSVYFSPAMMPPIESENAIQEFTDKCTARIEAMMMTHD